mgnify:CR=1 FL=1
MNFKCERCHRTGRYSSWVTSRWHSENMMHRCDYCGTPHTVAAGRPPEALGLQLVGIADHRAQKYSPWYDHKYRPYATGVFECEFRDGMRLRLMWNGWAWTWTGRRVTDNEMVKWRGCYL